jgi:hypothetical protein
MGIQHAWERRWLRVRIRLEKLSLRDNFEDLGIDSRIILK